jgi:hypothetical protein
MDIYTYIASSNPHQARALLHKYGYEPQNVSDESDLGVCLKKLVAYEGEDAFHEILTHHPDSNVIIEKYQREKDANKESNFVNVSGQPMIMNPCGGGCSGCMNRDRNFSNVSGNTDEEKSQKSKSEVSVFIMAAALMLAAAIIVKK